MKFQDILSTMEVNAFDKNYLEGLCTIYDSRDYGDTESDFTSGMLALDEILSDEQKQVLSQMEEAYKARRSCAAQYGFKCGIFGAFRQYFGWANPSDGGFMELVVNDLLTQPKMQRHHENFANIEKTNQLYASIADALSEEDQEHMVSVACAWDQRVYSAALDGFYCGYRAAYNTMTAIEPQAKGRNADKILLMEYHLGFIQPYSEVERLRERNVA